jgi:deoxyribodipyrimidine photolyase-related protein
VAGTDQRPPPPDRPLRQLVVVLGDQLDHASAALDGFAPDHDALWMAEVDGECRHVPSHKARIALFLAAMRHYRDTQQARGRRVLYRELGTHAARSLGDALAEDLRRYRPRSIRVVRPGEWRVERDLCAAASDAGLELEVLEDRHFLCSLDDFERWASGRRELRLEHFYRWMRARTGLLMEDGRPAGGAWNFDKSNRSSFGRAGPGRLTPPRRFEPDALTRDVLDQVAERFADHPGSLEHFDWPVDRESALEALADFIEHRLPDFGRWQDAIWQGQPWLYHSRLSAALNLKLLRPLEACEAAALAFREGRAPIESVEGFVRQVLGWREFVRGLYWHHMPAWLDRNELDAHQPLPAFYWTGRTDMACLADAITQTLEHGYAHHIQRLMVTGVFAMLAGVEPRRVHEWYLAVYVDAVEWVELPNTLGMSQFADGGWMASKPYAATGKYIQRMGNYCGGCRYAPGQSHGPDACPFTVLYWDFLQRHETRFRSHPRMSLQVRNLERLDESARLRIRESAEEIRGRLRDGTPVYQATAAAHPRQGPSQ